jgi:hypothetical protein
LQPQPLLHSLPLWRHFLLPQLRFQPLQLPWKKLSKRFLPPPLHSVLPELPQAVPMPPPKL